MTQCLNQSQNFQSKKKESLPSVSNICIDKEISIRHTVTVQSVDIYLNYLKFFLSYLTLNRYFHCLEDSYKNRKRFFFKFFVNLLVIFLRGWIKDK